MSSTIRFILTDIEGTTTSISFVYDVLFPYFREHLNELSELSEEEEVKKAIEQTIDLALKEEHLHLETVDEVIEQWKQWSLADKKITPLKTIQGVLWKKGYEEGTIKGHVYPDVEPALRKWKSIGIDLGVFSSGSVKAQKLLFGHSDSGNLLPFFTAYFDTTTGTKRESSTYTTIAEQLNLSTSEILFLSDIREELEAAEHAGMKTIQLVREGNSPNWITTAADFYAVDDLIQQQINEHI
jgi:enolase-phosphatase E1